MTATLTEVRLPAFKSIRGGVIRIGPVTLVAGRNGSGKSNLLDALAVLAALSTGASLRDALDGGREGPVVRGGSQGCAPLGTETFRLGASADWNGVDIHLDLVVRTSPVLQIDSERLWTRRPSGQRRGEALDLLRSDTANPESGDIVARWNNEKRGLNPPVSMRADQMLTTQVATRIPATSQAGRRIHEAAEAMLAAIQTVFILDPVPHQMREYVPEKDNRLRRNADNLSAVLARIATDEGTRTTLLDMTQSLSEAQVSDLTWVSSDLGDVMVTMEERIGGVERQVPARLMSDGTLRFLAVAAALLDRNDANEDGPASRRLLVVEELENGLHPSQASALVARLKEAAAERGVRTIATTHSPVILDALDGADHEFVLVTARDPEGWSTVTRLTDFPNYFELVGRLTPGEVAVRDRLRPVEVDPTQAESALAGIF